MLTVTRMGETTHGGDFHVLREKGHPVYLLLLVKTRARFEESGVLAETPPDVAVLFRPGQRHSYCALGEKYTDCWMHITSPDPLLYDGFPFGRPLRLGAAERFYRLFQLAMDEFYANRKNGAFVVHSLTSALLEMLSAETETADPLFYPFLSLREEVFRSAASPWRAGEAARRLGVSCGYFHTLYKKYFGTTFLADVIRARIQTAEELLASTSDPVERIAERCGYANVEHFIRQFRAAAGTTPAQYRRRQRPMSL